ncbi:MAG: hypothetical protein ACOYMV_12070, partial [Verrucomicrobiia bacterium]
MGKGPIASTADALLQGTLATKTTQLSALPVMGQWAKVITAEYGEKAAGEVVRRVAKELMASAAQGASGFTVMEAGMMASDSLTGNPDAFAGAGGRLADAALLGASMDVGFYAPAGVWRGAATIRETQRRAEFWDRLTKAKDASKLAQRDPEAAAGLIRKSLEDSGQATAFWVDPAKVREVFYQEGVDPEAAKAGMDKFAADVGLDPAHLAETLKTGGDLKVDMGAFAAHYGNSPLDVALRPEMRFGSPDAPKLSDRASIEAEVKQAGEEVKKMADEGKPPRRLELIRSQLMTAKEEGGAGMAAAEANYNVGNALRLLRHLSLKNETPDDTFNRLGLSLKIGEDGKMSVMQEARMSEQQAHQEMMSQNFDELLYAIKKSGGILAVSDALAAKEPLIGELQRVAKAHNKGKAMQYFRTKAKGAVGLDDLRGRLEGRGFKYETVHEMLAAIEQRLADPQNLPVYGTEAQALFQAASHGTPHEITDQFKLEKIGTGEGAAAYGWGLYFAEHPEVADQYRRSLTSSHNEKIRQAQAIIAGIDDNLKRGTWKDNEGNIHKVTPEYRKRMMEDRARQGKVLNDLVETEGNVYTVDIADEAIPNFLDWDKPLSEQSPEVRGALEKARKEYQDTEGASGLYLSENPTGEQIYREASISAVKKLASADGVQPLAVHPDTYANSGNKAASEYLDALGIKGVRYLDEGSRTVRLLSSKESVSGKWVVGVPDAAKSRQKFFDTEAEARAEYVKQRTSNFVVFDPSIVKITHKNGEKFGNSGSDAFPGDLYRSSSSLAERFMAEKGNPALAKMTEAQRAALQEEFNGWAKKKAEKYKAAREALFQSGARDARPVEPTVIGSPELARMERADAHEHARKFRDFDQPTKEPVKNADLDNRPVEINEEVIGEFFNQTRNQELYPLISGIREIVTRAVRLVEEPYIEKSNKRPDRFLTRLLYAPVEFNGKDWIARLVVQESNLHGLQSYHLKGVEIEMARNALRPSQGSKPEDVTSLNRATFTVAQIRDAVKQLWPDDVAPKAGRTLFQSSVESIGLRPVKRPLDDPSGQAYFQFDERSSGNVHGGQPKVEDLLGARGAPEAGAGQVVAERAVRAPSAENLRLTPEQVSGAAAKSRIPPKEAERVFWARWLQEIHPNLADRADAEIWGEAIGH